MSYDRAGKDITNQRFGCLTAIRLLPERSIHKHRQWECFCDCGSVTVILQGSLTTGNTKKCSEHPKNDHMVDGPVTYMDVSTGLQPHAIAMIDTEDLEMLISPTFEGGKMRWIAHNSNEQGHHRWGNYVLGTDRKTRMHRAVLSLDDHSLIVDHVNGDTFDNRKENLRVITRAENNKNMRKRVDNTTGATGVQYNRRHNNYKALITLEGTVHHLGTFNTLELANTAYRAAAKVLGFSDRHGTSC